jgi:hypothetical protein
MNQPPQGAINSNWRPAAHDLSNQEVRSWLAMKRRLSHFFPDRGFEQRRDIRPLRGQAEGAEKSGREGVWLEVPCPNGSCMKKEGKVVLEAVTAGHKEEKGIWLNIFCPEDSCLWKGGTELP